MAFWYLSVLVFIYVAVVPFVTHCNTKAAVVVFVVGAIWLCIAVALYGRISTQQEWVYGVLCTCYVVGFIAHVAYCIGVFIEDW